MNIQRTRNSNSGIGVDSQTLPVHGAAARRRSSGVNKTYSGWSFPELVRRRRDFSSRGEAPYTRGNRAVKALAAPTTKKLGACNDDDGSMLPIL